MSVRLVLSISLSLAATSALAQGEDDPARAGKRVFRLCQACHSLEQNGSSNAGPTLYGLFGRKAGGQADFGFSDAMKNSAVVWSDQTLDEYLTNPQKMIPGNKMALGSVSDREQRQQLIVYLKSRDGSH